MRLSPHTHILRAIAPFLLGYVMASMVCSFQNDWLRSPLSSTLPSLTQQQAQPNSNNDTTARDKNLQDNQREGHREADGCYHVFLDVGANVGVHGRFLLEPQKYPLAKKAHAIFDRHFGRDRDNRDFCVFAFEPNPNHRATIQAKSDAYRARGWRFEFHNVAASDSDGFLEFQRQNDSDKEEWGFAIARKSAGMTSPLVQKIPTIRLAQWILDHVANRKLPQPRKQQQQQQQQPSQQQPKVLMKLDIEGSEYVTLPDLITSGALCQHVDFVFGELHPWLAPFSFPPTPRNDNTESNKTSINNNSVHKEEGAVHRILNRRIARSMGNTWLSLIQKESRNCKTDFQEVDEENYLHDKVPLPEPHAT